MPEYQHLSMLEHVMKRPGMYIGSITPKEDNLLLPGEDLTLQDKKVVYSDGFLRLFIEIISNAIDNVWRSEGTDTPCSKIQVHVTEDGSISVLNDGVGIPIEINKQTNIYNPEMIFGMLLTGSNFNDDESRLTSGTHGVGSKVANIFSTGFSVDIVSGGLRYQQHWTDNMKTKDKPKITKNSKKPYTKITFTPDFNLFKLKMTPEIQGLLKKYTIEMAMLTKVNVYFNDKKIPVRSLNDYMNLYVPKDQPRVSIKENNTEIILTTTSSGFEQVSYVNGIRTTDGGVHIDYYLEKLLRPVLDKYKDKITFKTLKNRVSLWVNCLLVNPHFSSQTKTKLTGPKPTLGEDPKTTRGLLKLFKDIISEEIDSKETSNLKKLDSKKGFSKIKGFDPANLAGKGKKECFLVLSEGLSAKTFAVKGLKTGIEHNGQIIKGRDQIGILALKGKVLNSRNASVKQISNNTEINNIIQILNLKQGKDYTKQENFKDLSYQKLVLLTDSDVDGIHISGLIINFLHHMFPSLLKRSDFLLGMLTPIINVTVKNKINRFYTISDSEKFTKNLKGKYKTKYLKGLGSSTDNDIKETFGKRMVTYIHDKDTSKSINLVFNNKQSDQRKEWISKYIPNENTEIKKKMTISNFLDEEMIKFSIDDCERSIPNVFDGLKQSQRKILYASMMKPENLRVSQLSGFVSERTNYHHGEDCLNQTIIKMAQTYPTSNNIPLLLPEGQFGSRSFLGKDAASPRYIFVKCDPKIKDIYLPCDNPLLKHVCDDGDVVEPEHFIPIIPMILVNGITSIGTGWSSSIPSYNPSDLKNCVKLWMNNQELPEIHPWYSGFKGIITKVDEKKYQVDGILEKLPNNTFKISEIPVGMSIENCKDHLADLYMSKKIKKIKNYSTDDSVWFEFQPIEGFVPDMVSLKLRNHIHTSNLVCLEDDKLIKYDSVQDIIKVFCKRRFDMYKKRKIHQVKEFNDELLIEQNKYNFLKGVMSKKIKLFDQDENQIIQDLTSLGYQKVDKKYDYLLNMSVKRFTKQELDKIQKSIKNLEDRLKKLSSMTEGSMWEQELQNIV